MSSVCLHFYKSVHFQVSSCVEIKGHQRKSTVNSQSVQWYFEFWCSAPYHLLLLALWSSKIAAPFVLSRFYSCFYVREKMRHVHSTLSRTGTPIPTVLLLSFQSLFILLLLCIIGSPFWYLVSASKGDFLNYFLFKVFTQSFFLFVYTLLPCCIY